MRRRDDHHRWAQKKHDGSRFVPSRSLTRPLDGLLDKSACRSNFEGHLCKPATFIKNLPEVPSGV